MYPFNLFRSLFFFVLIKLSVNKKEYLYEHNYLPAPNVALHKFNTAPGIIMNCFIQRRLLLVLQWYTVFVDVVTVTNDIGWIVELTWLLLAIKKKTIIIFFKQQPIGCAFDQILHTIRTNEDAHIISRPKNRHVYITLSSWSLLMFLSQYYYYYYY